MESKNQDFLAMCLKVRSHCAKYNSDYTSIPGWDNAINFHNQLVDKLFELDVDASGYSSGVTELKGNIRLVLETICRQVSVALNAYAANSNDTVLAKKTAFNTSSYYNMSEEDLITRANTVYALAAPLSGSLDNYLVTSLVINNLQVAITDFVLAMPSASLARDEAKESRADLQATIEEIRNLQITKLDVLARLFEIPKPHLYNLYLSARAIDITGSASKPIADGVAPSGLSTAFNKPMEADMVLRFVNLGSATLVFSAGLEENKEGDVLLSVEPGQSRIRTIGNMANKADHVLVRNDAGIGVGYRIYEL